MHAETHHRLAFVDETTGLANRAALMIALEEASAKGGPHTLMIVGLEGLKDIDDTFYGEVTKPLLHDGAQRIRDRVDGVGAVARWDGESFAVLIEGVADPLRAADLAEALVSCLCDPFMLDGRAIALSARAGIATAPSHGSSAPELASNAGLALGASGPECQHRVRLFTHDMRARATTAALCRQDLRNALAASEFELH